MTRVAWFNCFAGIAGDMTLGSLVDAGADADQVLRILEQLPIGGWSLEFQPVMRNGISCTHAVVKASGDSVVRTWLHILGVLEEARLPEGVRDRAVAAFSVLAEAEGKVHNRSPSQVHFHEVGGHDTIVDIVGSAAALEVLGIDVVAAGPVATGIGLIRSSHGWLPNPGPAVAELLRGLPTEGRDLNFELTTPTGAAMLRAWGSSYGPLPAMTVEAVGYGAGTREIDGLPNCTQVVLGTAAAGTGEGFVEGADQALVVLETNLDDATGEVLGNALSALMDQGALDAWVTPVLMKKGRPGHQLSVLTEPGLAAQLADCLRRQTGSLGVRVSHVGRWASPRRSDEVEVDGLAIRVKVSPGRIKAEHEDVARVARRLGRPVIEVASLAEAAWHRKQQDEPPIPPGGPFDPEPA